MDTPSTTNLPLLDTARLQLRSVRPSDRDALFQIFSSPQAMRYWSCPPYTDRHQADRLIDDIHQRTGDRTLFQWGVASRENDIVIGTITLAALDWRNRRAEIGFILHPDYWRRGLISEALTRLLRHAFDDLQLHRIEADVDPDNIASLRTLERQGFIREGHLRERWRVGNGVQDSYFYGLLKKEWPPPGVE